MRKRGQVILILFTSQTVIFYKTFHPNGMFKCMALLAAVFVLLRHPIADDLVEAAVSRGTGISRFYAGDHA